MAFQDLSLDDQHGLAIAVADNLLTTSSGSPDLSEGSFLWLFLRTLAAGVTDNHADTKAARNDILPDTADGSLLDRWAAMLGVARKSATPARKDAALRVFGVPTSAVASGLALNHTSGLRFQTNGAAVVGAGGYVDVGVVAIDVGSQTRLNAGEQLTFDSGAPAGCEDIAELQLALDEDGVNEESDGDLRLRVLARLSNPPLGGAASDYVAWATNVVGIATAYTYPIRNGLGSVDLAALHAGTGAARVMLAGEVTSLKAVIDALRPVGVTFRVLTVVPSTTAIEYTVIPDGAVATAFDWDDSTPPVVLTWTGGTKTLRFNAARPTSMKVGDRLIVNSGDGTESIIEAFTSTDSVILEAIPAVAPSAADLVYAGGPLVRLIRAAIQAHVDSLGTANPDGTRYGTWEGNLRPGGIDASVRSIVGVLDGTVVAPVVLVEATDLPAPPAIDDGTIGLIIAGHILVRAQH